MLQLSDIDQTRAQAMVFDTNSPFSVNAVSDSPHRAWA